MEFRQALALFPKMRGREDSLAHREALQKNIQSRNPFFSIPNREFQDRLSPPKNAEAIPPLVERFGQLLQTFAADRDTALLREEPRKTWDLFSNNDQRI